MTRHAYIVSIDTATGEVAAAEVSRSQANALVIAPSAPRTVENYGRGSVVEAAKDALGSILPEQEASA